MQTTLSEITALIQGQLMQGEPSLALTGLNSLTEAGSGDLSFFGNEKYLPQLRKTKASAVFVPLQFPADQLPHLALIAVENPSMAFGLVMKHFALPPKPFQPGIHPSAVIHPTAQVDGTTVCIGPNAVIDAGAKIGAGSDIGAGCYVGDDVVIGEHTKLHPNVTILRACTVGSRCLIHSGTVIGSDGYGFENVGGKHVKIDQVGIVEIHDDVEIGSNTSIDRARFGSTVIGEGTKIDNLVQIAHNVKIGRHCLVAGQAGIAGSTRLADHTVVAAQAGIAGHLELASGVVITGQSGVSKSLTEPGVYMGNHAQPMRAALKELAALRQLPELLERVKKLEAAQRTREEA